MSNQHAVSRPPEREYDDASSCDFFSYAYLSLAFFLFLCGSGLTFLVLRSDQTLRNPLNRFWMAGPLFICTGLLVALKVLLYVRRKPRVRLEAIISGGGQERGLRSGTLPAPLVVGFGAACELASNEMEYDSERIQSLSERFLAGVKEIPNVIRNGDSEKSYPGCLNLSFAYVEGESLLMALKDVALSSGSACTSASLEPSYVLRAIGAEEDLAHSSIRFGLGRFTSEEDVDYTSEKLRVHVKRLREMSPLWEMVQEGVDLKTIKWTQH